MKEFIELVNASIQETEKAFLDEMLKYVEAETNRIEQLCDLAQRVDEMTREAIGAKDNNDLGAGDVDRLRAQIHNQHVIHTEQRHIIEGQFNEEPDLQNVFTSQQASSNINRSKSLILIPTTSFDKITVEPTDSKPCPISRSLPVFAITKQQHDADSISSRLVSGNREDSPRSTMDIDVSNLKDIPEYPRLEIDMKTVKASRDDIKVYSNDEMDEIELNYILSENNKTSCTNKEINTDTDGNKKRGFISRARRFLRRMCCCSVQEEGSAE